MADQVEPSWECPDWCLLGERKRKAYQLVPHRGSGKGTGSLSSWSLTRCFSVSAEFSIWTREAGAGGLSIAVEGPSKAEITFDDHKNGSCGVSYIAQEPGMFSRASFTYLCMGNLGIETHQPSSST